MILAVMPFAAIDRPALGVSTLKGGLERLGIECSILYLNIAYAEHLGAAEYSRLSADVPYTTLVGEWVFGGCLFGQDSQRETAYLDRVLRRTWRLSEDDVSLVRHARSEASRFLDACLARFSWGQYALVGFSSFCAQNTASLALARMIKLKHPALLIAFGGHNWEGSMGRELLRRFPFVDVAFSGAADGSFPTFLQCLRRGGSYSTGDVPGLVHRVNGRTVADKRSGFADDLDALPVPDHGDYFETFGQSSLPRTIRPIVPLETSRGCWWAAGKPCLFCGQNGERRAFRNKSCDRTIEELRRLSERWVGRPLVLVDNVVAPGFLKEVLPRLAAEPLPVPMSFMVRCDIGKDEVRLLQLTNASIRSGMESLNDHVLHLMRKGTRALENIRLLKWTTAHGIDHRWNMLYGCPGETAEDYGNLTRTIPSLTFLDPPDDCGPILIERFSPYFQQPANYGFGKIEPLEAYGFVYPFAEAALRRIAYFFTHGYHPTLSTLVYIDRLRSQVAAWRADGHRGSLRMDRDADDGLVLVDTRPGAPVRRQRLDDLDALLYAACDDIGRINDLHGIAGACLDRHVSVDEVDRRLSSFVERRLMIRDGDRYLSLALPAEPASTTGAATLRA